MLLQNQSMHGQKQNMMTLKKLLKGSKIGKHEKKMHKSNFLQN